MYLLDANVLMTAHNTYYPIDVVPEFWSWLLHQCDAGHVKMPIETFEEVKDGSTDADRDLLYGWIHDASHKQAIVLGEEVDLLLVQRVIAAGYANDLTDDEIDQLGRDPFLVAHALASPDDRIVVTTEASKPSKRRQNRRVPDVCNGLGVRWVDTFGMLRVLGFRTGWQRAP